MANCFYDAKISTKFEDTIQCSFYSLVPIQLDTLCTAVNETVSALSKDYIWHKDELKITVSVFDEEKKGLPVHLTSTTCFGDNIEDEWFIVYLVFKITSEYTNLVAQIEDNDGEFLLIEAAEFLPLWANPVTTKNRVFIYQNKIHIIPPEIVTLDSALNLQDALDLVVQKSNETIAIIGIQEAILKKIHVFPQRIQERHHRALVTLPLDIAALLTLQPSLISAFVLSFCNYDMLDAKCLKNMKFENCVTIPITFTKYLYAMLSNCKLPRISSCTTSSKTNKDVVLGIKLACGYEIIMSKSSDVFTSTEYSNFINRLTNSGYFRDNIKGSKYYKELLDKANDYFSNIECPMSSYFCNNISKLKTSKELKNAKDSLVNRVNVSKEDLDDDEWLNVNPDELNTFLNTNYGKKIAQNHVPITSLITSELANFLQKTSDFEGIEYTKEDKSDTNEIDFDSDQFISSVEKMLNLVTGKDNDVDLEDDFSEDEEITEMAEILEKELVSKLHDSDSKSFKEESIVKNLLQSIKEEGLSGPSSNLLKNIDTGTL